MPGPYLTGVPTLPAEAAINDGSSFDPALGVPHLVGVLDDLTTRIARELIDARGASSDLPAQLAAVLTAIAEKATDTAVVHDTGDETVAGQKTFTGPVLHQGLLYGRAAGSGGSLPGSGPDRLVSTGKNKVANPDGTLGLDGWTVESGDPGLFSAANEAERGACFSVGGTGEVVVSTWIKTYTSVPLFIAFDLIRADTANIDWRVELYSGDGNAPYGGFATPSTPNPTLPVPQDWTSAGSGVTPNVNFVTPDPTNQWAKLLIRRNTAGTLLRFTNVSAWGYAQFMPTPYYAEAVRALNTKIVAEIAGRISADTAHTADTTGIHGIEDTAALVLTGDGRLSDARTPTAHKSTHATGGSDALTPGDIGAATAADLSAHLTDTSDAHDASAVSVNAAGFDGNLATTDDTVQKVAQALDDLVIGGGSAAWKDPVRVATTANITLSGTQTIDGVAVVAGDRVLVKNQTTGSANGIYVVAAGAWTRAIDADTSAEVVPGFAVAVTEGATCGGKAFTLATDGVITVGTTALTFVRLGGSDIGFPSTFPTGGVDGDWAYRPVGFTNLKDLVYRNIAGTWTLYAISPTLGPNATSLLQPNITGVGPTPPPTTVIWHRNSAPMLSPYSSVNESAWATDTGTTPPSAFYTPARTQYRSAVIAKSTSNSLVLAPATLQYGQIKVLARPSTTDGANASCGCGALHSDADNPAGYVAATDKDGRFFIALASAPTYSAALTSYNSGATGVVPPGGFIAFTRVGNKFSATAASSTGVVLAELAVLMDNTISDGSLAAGVGPFINMSSDARLINFTGVF